MTPWMHFAVGTFWGFAIGAFVGPLVAILIDMREKRKLYQWLRKEGKI